MSDSIERVSGIVEAMRKDGKGFKLDDDNWYSVYEKPQLSGIGTGMAVSFKFKKKGDWNNVVGNVTGTTSTAAGSPTAKEPPFPVPYLSQERAIVRRNALNNAVTAVTSIFPDIDSEKELVRCILETAAAFEEYTAGDKEREVVESAMDEATEAA